MLYQKELPQKYETDVFIAGGGAAGVAAAIAAARCGKRVFLAESTGCFGGVGTSGLVPAFAPFWDGVNILAQGIGMEVRKQISKDIPLEEKWCPIRVEELKRTYDSMMTKAGVQFSFFTTLCDVISREDHIEHVVLCGKSGLFTVTAKVYIDCTGDGDLCAFGGGEFAMGDEEGDVMPATLCSLWSNIDFSRANLYQESNLKKAINDGIFSQPDLHLPGIQGAIEEKGIGGGNVGHVYGVNPVDEMSLTKAMITGRKTVPEYINYYREYMKDGYENIELIATASILGVRESRRITCDYTLSVEDFFNRAVFEDEIGRYCYPIDIHPKNASEEEYQKFRQEYEALRYKPGESYGIPYRSLISKSFSNLLTAGRCMGTDRQMQASVRVMPGCFITGQAAGVAAAMSCDAGETRAVKTKELQTTLKETIHAFLPNA